MPFKKIFYTLIATFSLVKTKFALAQDGYNFNENSGLDKSGEGGGFTNTVFDGQDSINSAVSQIITLVLSFLGVIFLVLTIYAGFQWMTAGGNEQDVTKAKERLKNSVIGLIIVLAAYAISILVTTLLADQTLTN